MYDQNQKLPSRVYKLIFSLRNPLKYIPNIFLSPTT